MSKPEKLKLRRQVILKNLEAVQEKLAEIDTELELLEQVLNLTAGTQVVVKPRGQHPSNGTVLGDNDGESYEELVYRVVVGQGFNMTTLNVPARDILEVVHAETD